MWACVTVCVCECGESGAECVCVDAESPVVSCPSDVSSTTDSSSAVYVYSWSSSGVDNVDGSLSSSCNVSSPHGFGVGTSVVGCTSTDSSGNVGSCSFSVSVTGTCVCWVIGCVEDIVLT